MIKIGSRGSKLALWQANWVAGKILARYPKELVPITIITTTGDRFAGKFTDSSSGKGMFVKEIEEALMRGEIDLAVHSMKDLPTELPEGLFVPVIPPREDARDALLTKVEDMTLENLPKGACIGTGSPRRGAQLKYYRQDLAIVPIRGNVDTRLRKLREQDLAAIILALAGLRRLGLEGQISDLIPFQVMLPAVAQGALGLEIRSDDFATQETMSFLHDPKTAACVHAERAFLKALGGGCQVPIAAHATVERATIHLQGCVTDLEGRRQISGSQSCSVDQAVDLGTRLAATLLQQGADKLI